MSKNCSFNSLTGVSYAIFIELGTSVSDVVKSGSATTTAQIAGFDAPLVSTPGTSSCEAFIDVADSQYLSVQANGTGRVPDDQLCQLVQPAAETVMANLAVLQP